MTSAPRLFDPDAYPRGLYDGRPPSDPRDGAGTSRRAADAIRFDASTLRGRVLAHIRATGGATDDEIETALDLRHQTASARRRELVLLELVHDTGLRRRTRSGRAAAVWRVTI